jgi:hypothetical protein
VDRLNKVDLVGICFFISYPDIWGGGGGRVNEIRISKIKKRQCYCMEISKKQKYV